MKKIKLGLSAAIAIVLVMSLSACSPGKLSMDDVTAVIDTRSADVYNTSHIVGAVNIDIELGDFSVTVVAIKKVGTFYVYGETEEQAGRGVQDMRDLGFPNVVNLGNFENAQNLLPLGIIP